MNKPAASFIIRPAQPGDVAAIVPLVKASWARTYDPAIGETARRAISDAKHVPDLFLAEIEQPDKAAMVALAGDSLIGHVGGYRLENGNFYVDHLHVDKALHGQGVAAALMDGLRDHLTAEMSPPPTAIELTVLKGNDRALAFYAKHGFIELGEAERLADIPAIHLLWSI